MKKNKEFKEFEKDDIRRYLNQKNVIIVKVANVRLRSISEKDPLNDIVVECLDCCFKNMGLIYFITDNYKIVKYGGSVAGVLKSTHWYSKLTAKMNEGRFIPNFFMRDQLLKGEHIEIYAEPLPTLPRESTSIETGEITQNRDVAFYKPREKEWQNYFKKFNIEIFLNRQERGEKENRFSQKYIQEYKERALKYKEYMKKKKRGKKEKNGKNSSSS